MVVSPSVNAMFSELALPRFALITAQNASSTACCSVAGSCCVWQSGSRFRMRRNKSSESVVPLMWSNRSSLSSRCNPLRTLEKSVMSPLCMNMYRPMKNGWQLYWCTLAPGPAARTCPKSNDEEMVFESARRLRSWLGAATVVYTVGRLYASKPSSSTKPQSSRAYQPMPHPCTFTGWFRRWFTSHPGVYPAPSDIVARPCVAPKMSFAMQTSSP
mmetsp:Transcript_10643/g.44597  ORF Transcript_10643/g.44597 Transcript_10643/m.44597 type:complete len:215 (-) Transcript_10643:70-714(-)